MASNSILARAFLSRIVLVLTLVLAEVGLSLAWVWRRIVFRRRRPKRCLGHEIAVLGNFHNPGWCNAHLRPIANARTVKRIYVVSDEVAFQHPRMTAVCAESPPSSIFASSIRRTYALYRVLKTKTICTIVAYHVMPNVLISLVLARIFSCRVVYQMTSGPAQIEGGGYKCGNPIQCRLHWKSWLLERWLMRMVSMCDSLVVRGTTASHYLDSKNIGKPVSIVTGAIDTDRFSPRRSSHVYDLVCVSRLVPGKGLERLIEVIRHLDRQDRTTSLALVGDGPMRRHLLDLTERYQLSSRVTFLGRQSDVESVLNKAKMFILLSKSEGVSIAMLEAMSCGIPVLVTRVGDLSDFVKHRQTGFLVEPDATPKELASIVLEILTSKHTASLVGENAREAILARTSLDKIERRWDRVFEHQSAEI